MKNSIQELPEIVLTANLSEGASSWTPVAEVHIGGDHEELGYKPSHESPTIPPKSFALASDGSIWFIDAAKQRVAHYTRDGHLVGTIDDSVGQGSTDLAFIDGVLHVIAIYHKGIVFPVDEDGSRGYPTVVTENGKTVYIRTFIPTRRGLFAEIGGYTDPVATGPIGVYGLELPGSGYITEVPGVRLENGTSFNLYAADDQEFQLQYFQGDREVIQPLRIEVIAPKQFGNRKLTGPIGPGGFVVDGSDIYMYVRVVGTRPQGNGDDLGGRYLLRVGESPILFERLPDPTNDDDTQVRHLALGPDGHIYLMQIDKDAVRIYRRP